MTDTPTTHKEMTLPESVTLYKVDIPNVGTMLTFAEPINPDCTFIMGEYTRHPKPMVQAEATLREDGGEPCCDVDLNETVWHDKYHQLCERCWKALGITEYTGLSIPEHIAALKNPSDAGGEE